MKTIEEIWSIVNGLKELYPDGVCSLDYRKDYELLFSVRLAAQCTDERVNKVTPALYARFPTLEALAEADIAEVERYIHSTGFFRAKAKDIVLASQMLLRDYGGRVPDTMEELLKLPGVGRKTANLILGDVYHTPGVVVADTHCIRISGLLGLTDGTKVLLKDVVLPEGAELDMDDPETSVVSVEVPEDATESTAAAAAPAADADADAAAPAADADAK